MDKMFYVQKDSTKVSSFIQIPKILFRDYSSLPLKCKIAYSLYLARYSATSYQDDRGPFIIFADAEMSQLIDTTADYARKVRKRLEKAGLIGVRRTSGYNKIYLYSYEKNAADEDMFFYEDSLDSWKFYRFPRELLDEKYACLPLEAKFLYAMYFDTMCLSQRMFFTDAKERIYFQDSVDDQILKSGFNAKTLRRYRDYLKACRLLNEYREFGKPIRYYLMKLPMFEDHVFELENMTAKEKSQYMESLRDEFARRVVHKDDPVDVRELWVSLKKAGYSVKDLCDFCAEKTGKSISVPGMRKYLNGSRRIPDEVFGLIGTLLGQGDPQFGKKDRYSLVNNAGTVWQKRPVQFDKKDRNIKYTDKTHTDKNYKNKNNTEFLSVPNRERNESSFSYSEFMNSLNNYELVPEDEMFVKDSLKYAETLNELSLHNYSLTLTGEDMTSKLQKVSSRAPGMVMASLNAMRGMEFETSQRKMKYFISVLFDKVEDAIEHPWQNNDEFEIQRYISSHQRTSDEFSDEVKNYKWW